MAQVVPHVGIVDKGPKVIRIVWMEQKALKHTNTCMGYIIAEVCETVRQRYTNRGGFWKDIKRECVCVAVDELDYMQCEYKSGGIYMPNTCKKRNNFVDSGPEVRVWCGKKTIYVLKIK